MSLLRLIVGGLLLLSWVARAAEPELLEPGKAFRFSARLLDTHAVEVRYEIAPGYYMYRDKFRFSAEPASITLDASQLPPGKTTKDAFFGEVQIYRGDIRFVLPLAVAGEPVTRFKLKAESQGCADLGVCYPPQVQETEVRRAAFSSAISATGIAPFLRSAPEAARSGKLESQETLRAEWFKVGFWIQLISFFGFGLLLALTPRVFSLIPVMPVRAPHGEPCARGIAFSLAYMSGMAITYALAGAIAGVLGASLSAVAQNPWVPAGFAAGFVLLAMSMFGFYELKLPGALQGRLMVMGSKLRGGHIASVFAMGVLSALIVGPCVAAPLAGALLYVSHSGDAVFGGSALFAMALGMGVPLLVAGEHAHAPLPKAGLWTEIIKRFFGIVLLGVALYLVLPLLEGAMRAAAAKPCCPIPVLTSA